MSDASDKPPRWDERWLFGLYQLATWATFTVVDDAAMLAFALS